MIRIVLLLLIASAIPAEATVVLVKERLELGPGICVIYEDIRGVSLRTQPCSSQATRFENFPRGTLMINNLRLRIDGTIEVALARGTYTVAFSPDDVGSTVMRPMDRLFSIGNIQAAINYVNDLTFGLFIALVNLALYATLFIRTRNPVTLAAGSVLILLANIGLLGRIDLTALVLTSITLAAALYYTMWKRDMPW